MLTRRRLLYGTAAAGASLAMLRTGDARAAASTVKTPVNFGIPRGACDCHVHVFDPAKFPYFSGRVYTPPDCVGRPDGVWEVRARLTMIVGSRGFAALLRARL